MSGVLSALYLFFVVLCALHGLHRLVLLVTWLRVRPRGVTPSRLPEGELPVVTVQLPVFNERDVVERLVDAVAALDWPADRLEIQLLDDSTDDTGARAALAVARAAARGIDVRVLRRRDRAGFKAGALAAGLTQARGELVAVFDADFVPAPDFLRALTPAFADPAVGMVQARWGHLDADASALTAAQATLLDGHFVVEHSARHFGGRWFNFNGTAGIWRRACIEAAGGWQHDTLTEDLDLSYRAQLAGWRFVYRPDHVVPAELPGSLAAFRSQQHRWAKGSVEVAKKLSGAIVRADVPWVTRAEALLHLWANLAWIPAVGLAAVLPLAVLVGGRTPGLAAVHVAAFVVCTGVSAVFYAAAAPRRLSAVPAAMLLGVGMAVHQLGAVLDALRGRRSPFVRTPKTGGGRGSYTIGLPGPVAIELALAALHLGTAVHAARIGAWGAVPFLLLFAVAFGGTGLGGLVERRSSSPSEPARLPVPAPEPVPGR